MMPTPIYFLYKKTHNKTGLNYLGQTQRNPFDYLGSGLYWQRHIKKYGYDVTTEIIGAFDTKEDLKVAGQFWSRRWNVAESKEWANLIDENGYGGYTKYTEKRNKKISQTRIEKGLSKGQNNPMANPVHYQKMIENCKQYRIKNGIIKKSYYRKKWKCPQIKEIIPFDKEKWRKNISESLKRNAVKVGYINPMKGKVRLDMRKEKSPEIKLKISLANKGKPKSLEHRKAMSEGWKNRKI